MLATETKLPFVLIASKHLIWHINSNFCLYKFSSLPLPSPALLFADELAVVFTNVYILALLKEKMVDQRFLKEAIVDSKSRSIDPHIYISIHQILVLLPPG